MFTLHVEANTYAELAHKVAVMFAPPAIDGIPPAMEVPAPATEPPSPAPDPKVTPINEKRPPGRPRKAAPEALPDEQPPTQPAQQASAPKVEASAPSSVTIDTVKAALHKLAARRADESNEVAGMNRVFELINQFKKADGSAVRKINELQPADWATVQAKADAAVKA